MKRYSTLSSPVGHSWGVASRVLLVVAGIAIGGCLPAASVVSEVQNSKLRGKDLRILALPPLNNGVTTQDVGCTGGGALCADDLNAAGAAASKFLKDKNTPASPYVHGYVGLKLQSLTLSGIEAVGRERKDYKVVGTPLSDPNAIAAFYAIQQRNTGQTRDEQTSARNAFLSRLISHPSLADFQFSQVLFGQVEPDSPGHLKVSLFIYDGEERMTLPSAEEDRRIRWNPEDKRGAAEDVARAVRNLIIQHFFVARR